MLSANEGKRVALPAHGELWWQQLSALLPFREAPRACTSHVNVVIDNLIISFVVSRKN
jgi:hypothetical protein